MGKALRRFVRSEASIGERELVAREVSRSSPRAGAMVAVAFMDDLLLKLIVLHFENLTASESEGLFESDRTLGTFSAKIKLARALGVFGPRTAHDLNLMREIRNAFAHGLRKMTFETTEIRQLLHSMNVVHDIQTKNRRRARKLFFEATAMLVTHLNQKRLSALKVKRVSPNLGCFCPHLD